MSKPLLGVAAALYVGIAFGYFLEGNKPMGLVFLCYAGSNVGFILA